jgi:hypothetical protein
LSSLRNEKRSFEALINTKAHMALPVDQDGRSGQRQRAMKETSLAETHIAAASTRRAGGVVGPAAVPTVFAGVFFFFLLLLPLFFSLKTQFST